MAPETLWLVGPSVTLTIAGTLALSYNRSRIFLACCLLAFCLWTNNQPYSQSFAELVLFGLVPMNILLLCFYAERGAFTLFGAIRLALIVVQIGLVVFWTQTDNTIPASLFNPFQDPIARVLQYLPFDQLTSLLLTASVLGCLFLMGLDTTPITQGITTALLSLIAAHTMPADHSWEIFLMAGSLYLGVSIIRDSYNMAYRDELTGLSHRRALNEQFLSLGSKYSLAMLDVDHFKKFNDTHGHDIGDQVLQMVAGKIQEVGGGGRAFRYGGEEFTVVFPRMMSEDAFYFLDELRKSIQNYEMVVREQIRFDKGEDTSQKQQRQRGSFRTADAKVSVTISIGVAHRTSADQSPEDVLKAADQALYKAKKAGRNQVTKA